MTIHCGSLTVFYERIAIMATKKLATPALTVMFKSIRDMAYNHAVIDDSLKAHAQFAMDNFANFPEETSTEERAEFYEGCMVRYNEIHPTVQYARIDGNWLPLKSLSKDAKPQEIAEWNGAFALTGFSQQAFGSLKNEDSAKHAILKPLRDAASKYASGKLKSLEKKAKEIIREKSGESKTRDATKAFDEVVKAAHDGLKDRCKNAKSRGDVSADEDKYRKAVEAFNAVWLK
jgi:hypothetical protein